MNFYVDALQQYATFSGKATRQQYWMFVLINAVISLAIGYVSGMINLPIIATIYSVALIIPGIAIGVRRLHDINKSGLWLFLSFLPVIGWIWLIILMATPSK